MMPTLNPLSGSLHFRAPKKVLKPCVFCGEEVPTYPTLDATCSAGACQKARDRRDHRRVMDQLITELDEKLPRVLANNGMGQDALKATPEAVTPHLWARCEPLIRELMRQPENPKGGFGLLGKPGTGKTCLMAVVAWQWARAAAEHSIRTWGVSVPLMWAPLWVNWATILSDLRAALNDGPARYAERMERLKEVPLLVVDDVGAERASEDSWGDERLYEVVEARSSAGRATLWTSNLTKEELRTRYPGRTVSRLVGMAPAVEVPLDLGDRRFAQARERMRQGCAPDPH